MLMRHSCAVGLLLPALLFSAIALADDPELDDSFTTNDVFDLPPVYVDEEDGLADDLAFPEVLVLPVSASSDLAVFDCYTSALKSRRDLSCVIQFSKGPGRADRGAQGRRPVQDRTPH